MRIIGEPCIGCAQKEAELESLTIQHINEIETLRLQMEKLKSENEALVMDVAFYGGGLTNLSCNNK
jgi:hypothetical protein